jgi:hypothetical protein
MAKIAVDWTQKTAKADRDQKDEATRALSALAETDWYVLRLAETGEPIPNGIRAQRAQARKIVSDAAAEKNKQGKK